MIEWIIMINLFDSRNNSTRLSRMKLLLILLLLVKSNAVNFSFLVYSSASPTNLQKSILSLPEDL